MTSRSSLRWVARVAGLLALASLLAPVLLGVRMVFQVLGGDLP